MKVKCLQMDMKFASPKENFEKAEKLIEEAAADADVLVLPETWNTGFFPKEDLRSLCDSDGKAVKERIGALAKKYKVNIVAGSVSNLREDKVYNTAMVFDRAGECIASYDKTHLFTPMGEDDYYEKGDHLCRFKLDGADCGLIICYDIRFPELTRSLTVNGLDMLFVVSQWPSIRTFHLRSLTVARAIENQMFVVCCNSCGKAGETIYGGKSAVIDPWGETLALASEKEEILSADCDMHVLDNIRKTIPVFRDRRPNLYEI
ncbi:MAG: carbon-nitrogen family hydrolase [Clostridia bacterium]|nr:carbon-nitrogen family hydrolase [Clostridia bacterium]MBQ6614301.1 carbon-nitrogen family hydrolase [Clostridia bacterium]